MIFTFIHYISLSVCHTSKSMSSHNIWIMPELSVILFACFLYVCVYDSLFCMYVLKWVLWSLALKAATSLASLAFLSRSLLLVDIDPDCYSSLFSWTMNLQKTVSFNNLGKTVSENTVVKNIFWHSTTLNIYSFNMLHFTKCLNLSHVIKSSCPENLHLPSSHCQIPQPPMLSLSFSLVTEIWRNAPLPRC